MEENEQEALKRQEDKDYGFPFVEVKPLSASENPKPESTQGLQTNSASALVDSEKAIPISVSNPIPHERKKTKKRSQAPLLVTLVLLLVVVLSAMAYFLYFGPTQETVKEVVEINQPKIETEPAPVAQEISADTVVSEALETQETVEEAPKEVPIPTVTQPQSLPKGAIGNLNLVESKGERSVYYLIVASLPNERIAREEAQVFLNKGIDVWMIFPSGDTKNYRLSVGSFGSFKSASDALPQSKVDFGESTWILKY